MSELHDAVYDGSLKKVKSLLRSGFDIDERDDDGMTALMIASNTGNASLVNYLLGAGADISITDDAGMTAYAYASSKIAKIFEDNLGGTCWPR